MKPLDSVRAPASAATPAAAEMPASGGLALGFLAVLIFAMTVPMTRLAVGDQAAPQLPPAFVTIGRAAFAGILSLLWLRMLSAALPPRRLWPALACCAVGTVLGFPLGLALALRDVSAMHAAVVTGLLPLATAVAAALWLRQRASFGFWACAVLGFVLVLSFAAVQGAGHLQKADVWLFVAMVCAAVGYVAGAHVSATLPAQQTICWVLVLCLPLTLPGALWFWPQAPASTAAWVGFGYVSLFSMWLGFFAWYRALTIGGVMRVSQVQLLQPFLALLLAVPVLGERLDAVTLLFAAAVVGVVFVGKRMPVAPATPALPSKES